VAAVEHTQEGVAVEGVVEEVEQQAQDLQTETSWKRSLRPAQQQECDPLARHLGVVFLLPSSFPSFLGSTTS
jgi:hypothetical protein